MIANDEIVFLSYSSRSENAALELIEDLKELGHLVWFDRGIPGGQNWWDEICANIEVCKFFVLAMDNSSLESEACEKEWCYAQKLGKSVLAVEISNVSSVPVSLRPFERVDYTQQDHVSGLRLSAVVARVPVATPISGPKPKRPEIPISYLNRIVDRIETDDLSGHQKQNQIIQELERGIREDKKAREAKELLWSLKDNDYFIGNSYLEEVISRLKVESPGQWPGLRETSLPVGSREKTIVRWLGDNVFKRSLKSWLGIILPLSWAARCLLYLVSNPNGSEGGTALLVVGAIFFSFVAWFFYALVD